MFIKAFCASNPSYGQNQQIKFFQFLTQSFQITFKNSKSFLAYWAMYYPFLAPNIFQQEVGTHVFFFIMEFEFAIKNSTHYTTKHENPIGTPLVYKY